MGRRSRKDELPIAEELYKMLLVLPSWCGPLIAAFVFVLFGAILPSLFATQEVFGAVINPLLGMFAPFLAAGVLMLWVIAEGIKYRDRKRLDKQTGQGSIESLTWHEFERLLAEAFRREGYQVGLMGGAGPDGGVDLRLRRSNETTLVQCKQWKKRQVGVSVVRELYGVVASENATTGIVVTSGRFTRDAITFASQAGVRLIDGEALLKLIQSVQSNPSLVPEGSPVSREEQVPGCPSCGTAMVVRVASKGANRGSRFWGCTDFPRCRGLREFAG